MNEAIRIAIENGWNAKPNSAVVTSGAFALESSFWQALGKALGWKDITQHPTHTTLNNDSNDTGDMEECDDPYVCCLAGKTTFYWLYYARQYFDLVLTVGDTEKFWKELLNN